MATEFTPTTEISDNLPKWIFYFGCLLTTIGIVAGLLGVVSPTTFFSDFPNVTQWPEISYITTAWGLRSLAMGAVMLLALWMRLPSSIGLVFSIVLNRRYRHRPSEIAVTDLNCQVAN